MMLGKFSFELLPIIRRCKFATELKFVSTLKRSVKREYGTSSTSHAEANNALHVRVDEELREIFKFKDTKISNWIVEVTNCISLNCMIKRSPLFFSHRNCIPESICRTRHVRCASDIPKATRIIASEFYAC